MKYKTPLFSCSGVFYDFLRNVELNIKCISFIYIQSDIQDQKTTCMKNSKKASTKIIEIVQKIDPSRSKLTTYDEAWEVISKEWGLTGDLKTTKDTTTFLLTVDQDITTPIHKFEWNTTDVFEEGDWDWTTIFGDVLKYVIKNKLNNPKNIKKHTKQYVNDAAAVCLKNTSKKLEKKQASQKPSKTEQISKIDPKVHKLSPKTKNTVKSQENTVKNDFSNQPVSKENLKAEKMRIYMKIRYYKKKNKDTAELEKEYKRIVELIEHN